MNNSFAPTDTYEWSIARKALEEIESEITQEIQTNDRSLDIADNLSDMKDIITRIDNPTDTDIALIQTAANMAVAGTDEDARLIVPSLEEFKNKVALEEIDRKLVSAAVSSLRSSSSIWARLKKWLSGLFDFIKAFKNDIDELSLKTKALEQSGAKVANKVAMHANPFFFHSGSAVTDFDTYVANLRSSVKVIDVFSKSFIPAILSTKNLKVKDITRAPDQAAYQKEFLRQHTQFQETYFNKNRALTRKNTSKKVIYLESEKLANNRIIRASIPNFDNLDATSLKSIVGNLNSYKITVEKEFSLSAVFKKEVRFNEIRIKALHDLVNTLHRAVDTLAPYAEDNVAEVFYNHVVTDSTKNIAHTMFKNVFAAARLHSKIASVTTTGYVQTATYIDTLISQGLTVGHRLTNPKLWS